MIKFEGNKLSKGISKGILKVIKIDSEKCDYNYKDFEKALSELKEKYSKYEDDYLMQSRILMMEDEEFINFIKKSYKNNNDVFKSLDFYYEYAKDLFSQLEDEYLKERIHDIKDLVESIKLQISNSNIDIKENVILYMEDMSASLFIENKEKIVGLLTKKGSYSSHVAILARTYKIPMLTNIEFDEKYDDKEIFLDCVDQNAVFIEPSKDFIENFEIKKNKYEKAQKDLEKYKDKLINYKDKKINFKVNIGSIEESEIINGVDGIGLLRTEFILFDRKNSPSFEEQKNIYKKISNNIDKKEIILRTFDIGGDKQIEYLNLPKEENPFLGKRGIRLYQEKNIKKLIEDQVKSIFELNEEGHNFKIMIPMVSNNKEIDQFFDDFIKPGQDKYKGKVEFGIMVETPSMALSFHKNKNIDFISVGTNDLTQYTLAVDRTNDSISNLYNYFDDGVLELIKIIINNALKEKIKISFCGESAAIPEMAIKLIKLGVNSLSMNYSSISEVKKYLLEKL